MNPRRRSILSAAALVFLAFAAYANSFTGELVLDSTAIIGDDPRLRAVTWANLRAIFTESYWWPTFTSELYRPLTTLSFWLNYSVLGGGTETAGYHLLNFSIHAANVLLLWRVLSRWSGQRVVAWVAAAAFGVHPLGAEAVTNIVGRLACSSHLACWAQCGAG